VVTNGGLSWASGGAWGWEVHVARDGHDRTVARGSFPSVHENDDGYVEEGSVGAFAAAGNMALLELRGRSGSSKYDQYDDTSSVAMIDLKTGHVGSLGGCSAHVDAFNGPGAGSPVGAQFATDGEHAIVSVCGGSRFVDARGKTTATALGDLGGGVVAGEHVAQQLTAGVVVRDWKTGETLYTVPTPADTLRSAFALMPDGALAISRFTTQEPGCASGTLTWASPAMPGGMLLPVAPCTLDLSAGGARAVVVAEASDGPGRVLAEISAAQPRRDVAWLGTGAGFVGGIDAREGPAAYALACGDNARLLRAGNDATPHGVDCPDLRLYDQTTTGNTLLVRASVAAAATARVTATVRVVGRTLRHTAVPRSGRLTFRFRLPVKARRVEPELTLVYPGDAVYIRQLVRG
ncbi:MAG: hypothetical protein JWM31_178, partial [Solirubrobacterales bacterium]|nr:hypothetical protein [Solirubrobacterales bacterium]